MNMQLNTAKSKWVLQSQKDSRLHRQHTAFLQENDWGTIAGGSLRTLGTTINFSRSEDESWASLQGQRELVHRLRMQRLRLIPDQKVRISAAQALNTSIVYGAITEGAIAPCTQQTTRTVINAAMGTTNTRLAEEIVGTIIAPGHLLLPTWASAYAHLKGWIDIANTVDAPAAAGAYYCNRHNTDGKDNYVVKPVLLILTGLGWQWPAPFTWRDAEGIDYALQHGPTLQHLQTLLRDTGNITTGDYRNAIQCRANHLKQQLQELHHKLREGLRTTMLKGLRDRRQDYADINAFDFKEHRHYLQTINNQHKRAAQRIMCGAILTADRIGRYGKATQGRSCAWCGSREPETVLHRFWECRAHTDIRD